LDIDESSIEVDDINDTVNLNDNKSNRSSQLRLKKTKKIKKANSV